MRVGHNSSLFPFFIFDFNVKHVCFHCFLSLFFFLAFFRTRNLVFLIGSLKYRTLIIMSFLFSDYRTRTQQRAQRREMLSRLYHEFLAGLHLCRWGVELYPQLELEVSLNMKTKVLELYSQLELKVSEHEDYSLDSWSNKGI